MRLILPELRQRCRATLHLFSSNHKHLVLNFKYPEKDLDSRQQKIYKYLRLEKFLEIELIGEG